MDIPDHQLDEEGIREKRKQRLMKAGYDARMRAKAEKGEEKRRAEEEKRADEEARLNDPREWAKTTRKEYAVRCVATEAAAMQARSYETWS